MKQISLKSLEREEEKGRRMERCILLHMVWRLNWQAGTGNTVRLYIKARLTSDLVLISNHVLQCGKYQSSNTPRRTQPRSIYLSVTLGDFLATSME